MITFLFLGFGLCCIVGYFIAYWLTRHNNDHVSGRNMGSAIGCLGTLIGFALFFVLGLIALLVVSILET